MALLGPFSVGYPVAFRTGGDTTREAFGKHIQEIERIYGILNALDAGKVSADDLDKAISDHVNSTNPHPKWKPSLSFSDISGNLDGSRLTGKINAELVYGLLSNATIDVSHVNNLESFVKSLIPTGGGGEGEGITESNLQANGYIKFSNGFMLQWGKISGEVTFDSGLTTLKGQIKYVKSFSSKCFSVLKCEYNIRNNSVLTDDGRSVIITPGKEGFDVLINLSSIGLSNTTMTIDYCAIGI